MKSWLSRREQTIVGPEGIAVHHLQQKVESELRSGILAFWLNKTIDHEYGGFRGQIANDLASDPLAPKGLILNARILWTFSKAFSVYKDPAHLVAAHRAYEYLCTHFWDAEFGGLHWMLGHTGNPLDTKKRIYGQAFSVYAFAEYAHAVGNPESMDRAVNLMKLIEAVSHDDANCGYFETYEHDWTLALDQRLSDADMDEKKSMNTHLHMLEAYATLLRYHEDVTVRFRLRELIEVFLKCIVNPANSHFFLFFDEQWRPQSKKISFGHDIEGSWLLCEAAEVLGDAEVLARVRTTAVNMAQAVHDQGLDTDGGLLYEAEKHVDGTIEFLDTDKHWWPQAEAVVGFLNAFELSGRTHFLRAAEHSWQFIEQRIVDPVNGEWFWLVSRDGAPNPHQDKVGPWKCPYHNSRMCFEVAERLIRLERAGRLNAAQA